jgi:protein-tyrosine phosphatase
MSATQIWERLWVGNIFDAKALAESNPQHITTIITLSPEAVPEELSGVNHLYLPVLGNHAVPVGMFDEIIDALWENIRWGNAFVHSFDGVNRAPIMAAAWMHCCGYKNIDAALEEIGKLRTIEPNRILLSSIKELL